MNLSILKECMEDGSLIIFMSLDGIIISSNDPLIGQENSSIVLKSETDFQPSREYPEPGDRLENYHVNRETGDWYTTPSCWVVFHVEKFLPLPLQITREVVIAWCKKEPVTMKNEQNELKISS